MNDKSHYLKQELYDLIQNDDSIFDFLQSGSLDGIWYWDLENTENEWMSPRFWTTLGYDPHTRKHLAAEWQDLIHPGDLQVALENFNKHCADSNHPYDQVVRYQHANGSTVWVRCRGIAIRDKTGKPIRMLGAHTDITPQKRAEEALQQNQERLTLAVESAQIGIWDLDLVNDILAWDKRMFSIYGIEPDTFDGAYEAWQKGVHPDDLPKTDAAVRQAIDGVEPFDTEFRVVWPSGEVRHVRAFASVVHNKDGSPIRMTGVNLDITDAKKAEAALRESERLQGVLEMAGAVCHEMNQPLMILSGLTDLLAIKTNDDSFAPELEKMKTQVQRIASINSKLMNIAGYRTKQYLDSKIVDIDQATVLNY